jgi:Fur family ferric uptake transcriptional regulator
MKQQLYTLLKNNNLRFTKSREIIFNLFVKYAKHKSCAEIYDILKNKYPSIGRATVYRTLKIFSQMDIAQKVNLDDRINRFESKLGDSHHDHLKCIKCGKIVEFVDKKIENRQQNVAKKYKFKILWHRQELFGLCSSCSKLIKKEKNK